MADSQEPPPSTRAILRKLGICAVNVMVSAILIRFNKHMMHKDRFPYASALASMHMLTSMICCNILYRIRPSMFPAMANVAGHRREFVARFIPIGGCFAVMLWGSNQAYLY